MTDIPVPAEWRYSINYGPEGEANYAFVYDGGGHLVSNLKIHHAIAIVEQMNRRAAQAERMARLEEALRRAACPRPCNGRPDDFEVGQCVDAGECGCCLGAPLTARALSQEGSEPS